MFILDTNVISELRTSTADGAVRAWFGLRTPSDLYLSAISVFELEHGVRRMERRDQIQGARLRRWLDEDVLDLFRGRVLPIDHVVAVRAAGLHVHDPRPERDCFIAATALVHAMTVVTRNMKDFQGLGVLVVNPWDG